MVIEPRLLRAGVVAALVLVGIACIDRVPYPACKSDKQCKLVDGEVCIDGLCQNCKTDADCAAREDARGPVCIYFRCSQPVEPRGRPVTGGPCAAAGDCPADHVCNVGRCEPAASDPDPSPGVAAPH